MPGTNGVGRKAIAYPGRDRSVVELRAGPADVRATLGRLTIGSVMDHMPSSLNRQNVRRYRKSPSLTEFKEFPGRTHYSVIGGPGWDEVADYALAWAARAADGEAAQAA